MIGTNRRILQFIVHLALILMAGIFAVAARASELNDEIKWIHEEVKSDIISSLGLSILESPGSIRILTKQEIEALGARDLTDIIRTMPSIQLIDWPGYWVESPAIYGMNIGTRLYIDGHEITDRSYGTCYIGRFVPIQNIDRIEIISGGAASLKGGGWSACVINVVLDKQKTNTIKMSQSTMGEGLGTMSLNYNFSDTFAGWDVYLQAGRINAHKSDRIFTEPKVPGSALREYDYLMFHQFISQSELVDLTLKKDNLVVQAFSNRRVTGLLNAWTEYLPGEIHLWRNEGVSVTFRQPLLPDLMSETHLAYDYFYTDEIVAQQGASIPDEDVYYASLNYQVHQQKTVRSEIYWQPNDAFGFSCGGYYSIQTPIIDEDVWNKIVPTMDPYYQDLYYSKGAYKTITSLRAYSELFYRSLLGQITLGGSIEKYSTSRMSKHPRVSYSKKLGPLHIKASYQESFQNAHLIDTYFIYSENATDDSTQEYATLEGLYLFGPDNYLRVGLTNQVSKGFYAQEAFSNSRTRLPGDLKQSYLDIEYACNSSLGQSNFGLSTYLSSQADETDYPGFVTPGGSAPGAAKTKASFRHSMKIGKELTIAPNIYFLSDRYGVHLLRDPDNYEIVTGVEYLSIPPCLVLNVNLTYKTDLFSINAGVFNITNANEQLANYESQDTGLVSGSPIEFNIGLTFDL